MNLQWQLYRRLELITHSSPQKLPQFRLYQHLDPKVSQPLNQSTSNAPLRGWFTKLGQALEMALIRDLEPRFWQSSDATGKTCWHLYDPETGRTIHLDSEAKVRLWLELLFRT